MFMSRSPRFFSTADNPFPLFSKFSFPSDAIKFVAYAHDLFLKNELVIALIEETNQKHTNVSISLTSDTSIFSFGFFSYNYISIRNSLNLFEKSMVLLF